MAFDFFVRRNGICIPLTCEPWGGAGEILIIRTMMMLYTMDACNLYLNLKVFDVLQFRVRFQVQHPVGLFLCKDNVIMQSLLLAQ